MLDIEKQTGLSIELEEQSNLDIYPKIYFFNSKVTIFHKNSSILIGNSSLTITKSYWPFSPFNINLKSPMINLNGFELNNVSIHANYKDKIIKFIKFNGDLIGGKFDITGDINLNDQLPFNIKGQFKNISLNTLLKQSGINLWDRITIKLSSEEFSIFGYAKDKDNFVSSLKGEAELSGSGYLLTTDEERFGAALLSLLVEKLPSLSSMSKLYNFIISTYGNIPTFIKGNLMINNNKILLKEINIENELGKSSLNAELDLKKNDVNGKIYFYEDEEVFIETVIKGNMNDPEILIKGNVLDQDKETPKDIRKIFKEGISSIVDKLLKISD